jgi:hypothetical protein
MTDNEIKQAFEEHIERTKNIKYGARKMAMVDVELLKNTLDLINRQQAEIARLKAEHDKNFEKWEILDKRTKERYAELYEEAKAVVKTEAIKEFAERLKALDRLDVDVSYGYGREHYTEAIAVNLIDNLVKEMVGEE